MFEGGFRQILRREVDAIPLPPEDKWVPAVVSAGSGVRARIVGAAATLAILLGVAVLSVTRLPARPATQEPAREVAAAASCEETSWPTTEISCTAARNISPSALYAAPGPWASYAAPGPWTVRIWLTTLGAVDAHFPLARRQVSDHSPSAAPVWLFIYESSGAVERVLSVGPASNARPGVDPYIYRWADLGSPEVPKTMPLP
jgi:hypothetical protein